MAVLDDIAGLQPHQPRCNAARVAGNLQTYRNQLVLIQAGGSNTPTSIANIDLHLDLDVSRGSNTFTFAAYIKMQLVLDASRQE